MAEDRMAVLEMLRKATADGDVDFLREGVRVLAQAVMEAEVSELTGLPKGERDPERRLTSPQRVPRPPLGHPGGHDRPRDPQGPRRLVLPEPARAAPAGRAGPARGRPGGVRAGRQHAPGRRPRRALGIEGISRSEVSRICAALDAEVAAFRGRSLAGEAYPYLWLDATYVKVREQGRVVSMAALVATGVAAIGRAADPGPRAAGRQRRGQRLAGLHPLARRARPPRGPPRHQRRPRGPRQGRPRAAPGLGLAALSGPLHPQRPGPRAPLGAEHGRDGHPGSCSSSPTRPRPATSARRVIDTLEPRFPAVARLLADAEPDLLAHFTFPETHRRRIRSHQPPGAAEQGDQAPDRGRRHLSQPGRA